jgi:hypothetical protein
MYQTAKASCNPVRLSPTSLRRKKPVLDEPPPLIVSAPLQAGTFYYVEITTKGWSDLG